MAKINWSELIFQNKGVKQTIIKNTFWLTISMIITSGVGFAITIWLARHFGPAGYGQWAFALSYVTFFSVLVEFGFDTITIREVSRDKNKASLYIDNIVVMKSILSLFTLGLIALIIQFLGKDSATVRLVYFLGIYMVINSFATFFQSIFRANEKMQYETACYVLQSIVLVGLVVFFILRHGSIISISYAYIGANLVTVLFALILIWRYFSKFFLKINFKVCKEIFSEVWAYGLGGIMIYFYTVDSVILGVIRSNEQVGWYNAAYRVPLGAQILELIILRSFFPQLSQKYKQGLGSLKAIVAELAKIMHFIAWPIAFGGMVLAGQIITFFYGKEYLPAKLALQILVWSMAINFLASIYMESIRAADRPKVYFFGLAAGAVLNITLNFLLIPYWGLNGAAVVALLTQITVLIFMHFQLNKLIIIKILPYTIVPLTSSIIMAGLIYFYFRYFNVVIAVILGALIYFLLYYLLSLLQKNLPFYGNTKDNTFKI